MSLGSEESYLNADVEFHLAMAEATKNEVLAGLYREFREALRGAIGGVIALPGVRERATELHARLVDAVARKDGEAAQAVTAEHLENVGRLLQEFVRRDER
jgi:DNA-binding FadR family transcriptional regulator